MAKFKSFRAFRPDKKHQHDIPALPYDVMNSDEAREMVQGKPLSFLHVDKAEIDLDESVDHYSPAVYQKAKENLLNLENSKALVQDSKNCFYIYRLTMNGNSQTGLVGCASTEDYMNNVIKKHELTRADKEQDRINHVNICDANTGPIFLTYSENKGISETIEQWCESHESVYDINSDGVRHTIWVVDDNQTNSKLENAFSTVESLYIADGHHRCASAVAVAKLRREANPEFTGDEEFNFFLAICFPDKQLKILDYNRVVTDLNSLSKKELLQKISEKFTVAVCGTSPFKPLEKHTFGMFFEGEWFSLQAKKEFVDETDPVLRLDVSILQNNLLSPILGISDPRTDKRIDFVGGIRGLKELERRAQSDMKIAFSMCPTTIDDLMSIADAGEIMPPKSTWFEPKPLSGFFIHHLS